MSNVDESICDEFKHVAFTHSQVLLVASYAKWWQFIRPQSTRSPCRTTPNCFCWRQDVTQPFLCRQLEVRHTVCIFVVPVATTLFPCTRLGNVFSTPLITPQSPEAPKDSIKDSCTHSGFCLSASLALPLSLIKWQSDTWIQMLMNPFGCIRSVNWLEFLGGYYQ